MSRAAGRQGLFSDHVSIHLLQLDKLSPQLSLPGIHSNDYATQVERWARFFTARSPAELHRVAWEDRIMSLAEHSFEQLSQDPEAQRLARIRSDEIVFYPMSLVASRIEGEAKGRIAGQAALLLEQLTLRFGPPSEATRARVAAASAAQLDAWAERVLDAPSLRDVLEP